MSAKKQAGGYSAQGAGLGLGTTSHFFKGQDRITKPALTEIEEEERWDTFFAANKSHFETLAAQALAEDAAGLTEDLDPEEL